MDVEWSDLECSGVSADDISRCAAVLREMRAADLERPEFASIREDVLHFLKKKSDVHQMTTKLQRLHKVVKDEHEVRRQKAETCGMNLRRKADLAAIKAESQLPEPEFLAIIGPSDGEGAEIEANEAPLADIDRMLRAPLDSFYSNCNMCRGQYMDHHHFYHQLCPRCADHNWEKRHQTADMNGMVCVPPSKFSLFCWGGIDKSDVYASSVVQVVTGGRVRIGYRIVLKLLRAGAFVLTTTRYPSDCAWRFSQESDYEEWRHRLEVCGPLELCDVRLVEHFCDQLVRRFPRINVLINNAAQTLTRQKGWNLRMAELEQAAAFRLHENSKTHSTKAPQICHPHQLAIAHGPHHQLHESHEPGIELAVPRPSAAWKDALVLQDFPEGELDESRQPLDRSMTNSWSRRIEDVATVELLQTLAANTAAPFILCSRLASVIGPKCDAAPFGHIVNVSALEGKFSVKNKSSGHPHTNMAKAALNMMTHTSCKDMFRRRILMNCVDTGWVTDMAPDGVGQVAATHDTWVGPPLDEEDGAARVLDPIFSHLKDPTWLLRGKFFKNYYVCGW
ncbi:unnamed protein product [Durusdinium trenchii]|uniref:Uncharacterized protein n=1 Tax=Durusdinium trenchii TaxID=1381693 RepID=A0ABP0QVD7_9DINO